MFRCVQCARHRLSYAWSSKNFPYGTVGLIWLPIAVLAWFVGVPGWISLANLSWLNVLALGLCAALLAVQRAGLPSRSIARILYDTEHPGRSGR